MDKVKDLSTLYKRTRTGAIQFWKVGVDDTEAYPVIVKRSGQLGTLSPTEHREGVPEGKNIGRANETTPLEQAWLQANSDWKKKHDEGYKGIEDFPQIQVRPTMDSFQYRLQSEPDKVYASPKELLEMLLPQFNTDAQGNVKPMLAKDWKKVKNIPYPVYCEPKLEGVRCLMIVSDTGSGPSVTFLSRSGKEYTTLGHIEDDVIKATWTEGDLKIPFILDGEIYSDELTFQEITQAVKKQYPNSLKLHFRAYDIVNDEVMSIRRNELKPLVTAIGSEFVQHITWYIATDASEVKDYHDGFVAEGNEGAMLRNMDGKYDQGQRSSNLLKVKEFDETEFEMTGYGHGQRPEDLLAECITKDGKKFKAKVEGSREQKEKFRQECDELVQHKDKYPKITVKHFGWTDDGLPRFPIGKGLRDYE